MVKFKMVYDHDEANGDYITFALHDSIIGRHLALFWMDGNGCQLCSQYSGDIPHSIELNHERRLKVVGTDMEAIL